MRNIRWERYLAKIRVEEIKIVFEDYNLCKFDKCLELGAGNGFQSELIINYCNYLVSTDINADRLKKVNRNDIEYKICDAEKINNFFDKDSFDLVFSSNMFEHLPNPSICLNGIKEILKKDGLVVLIMPSTFWKLSHMILYYPVAIINIIKRKYRKLFLNKDKVAKSNLNLNNNVKFKIKKRNFLLELIRWPLPHGVSKSHFEEFKKFKKSTWIDIFESNGFQVIKIKNGPVTSGYGLELDFIRKTLVKLNFTSEYIYYLKIK